MKAVGSAVLLLCVIVVAAVSALEVGLRIQDRALPQLSWTRGFLVYDAQRDWRGKPGTARWVDNGTFDVLVEHDERGYRKPEPAPLLGATQHLLVVGGSTAWGKGVGRGGLISDWLQRDAPPSVAVHNRAMLGYSVAQMELAIEQALAERHFDEVLLVLSPSDIRDANLVRGEPFSGTRLFGAAPSMLYSLGIWLEDSSWAARFLGRQWDKLGPWIRNQGGHERRQRWLTHPVDLSAVQEQCLSMIERVRAHGARFVLLYAPTQGEVEGAVAEKVQDGSGARPAEPGRLREPLRDVLAAVASRAKVPFVDLYERLRLPSFGRAPLFLEQVDVWSHRTHFLAAQWLADTRYLDATQRQSRFAEGILIEANHPHITYMGRIAKDESGSIAFDWPAVAIRARIVAPRVRFRVHSAAGWDYFKVTVDGEERFVARVTPSTRPIEITDLGPGVHEIELQKRNDGFAAIIFSGLELPNGGRILPPRPPAKRQIEILGASVAHAHGNEGSTYGWANGGRVARSCANVNRLTDASESFGAVLAATYGADFHLVAKEGRGIIRSWGEPEYKLDPFPLIYPRTLASRSGDWDPNGWHPDLVVANLGENDFQIEGPIDSVAFRDAYVALLGQVRERYPDAFILLFYQDDLVELGPLVEETVRARHQAGDLRVDSVTYPPPDPSEQGCEYHPGIAHHRALADILAERVERILGWEPVTVSQ